MRSDMPKLLVHTSRRGGPKNDDNLRVRRSKVRVAKVTNWDWNYAEDGDGPFISEVEEWEEVSRDDGKVVTRGKVAMRQKRYGKHERKEFGENLEPLMRYLQKQVGRPWDKVYSEIRAVCEPTGTVNAHIYQHLWHFVIKDVFIGPDGKPWQKAGAKYGSESPLTASPGSSWGALYVHPVTGLLCKAPLHKPSRTYYTMRMADIREENAIILRRNRDRAEPKVWLARVDDVGAQQWFRITLVPQEGTIVPLGQMQLMQMLPQKGFKHRTEEAISALLAPVYKFNGNYNLTIKLTGPLPHSEVGT